VVLNDAEAEFLVAKQEEQARVSEFYGKEPIK